MGDAPPPQGLAGKITSTFALVGQVAGRLTPEFLGLCVLNVLFLFGVLTFLHFENERRMIIVRELMAACFEHLEDKSQ